MKRYLLLAQTLWALGLRNVARVGLYRVLLRAHLHPVQYLKPQAASGVHFGASRRVKKAESSSLPVQDSLKIFGWQQVDHQGDVPDWHSNPVDGRYQANADLPWWKIPDFATETGDIKYIWELSRMDWVLDFAQRAKLGDDAALKRLNHWLADWEERNPPYFGANWKCGQEASIRVMHVAIAALILEQLGDPSPRLSVFLRNHLARIAPTLSYARGQSNNHATSEAAALYIGGHILKSVDAKVGARYICTGRKMLHDAVMELFAKDGSFSQYSLNYHRVALDTLSLVEVFRLHFGDEDFSNGYRARAAAATDWLHGLIMSDSGAGPLLGHNDGANLLALSVADYTDYRPSAQLASRLFRQEMAFAPGLYDDVLDWLEIEPVKHTAASPKNLHFPESGIVILRNDRASVLFRYPEYRFRPSQSDALHVDLWVDGVNILKDAGTFSYNATPEISEYFNGVASHNTVQFDGRDQMPRLGRFLFGEWLHADDVDVNIDAAELYAKASYTDHWKNKHERSVELLNEQLAVTDRLSGKGAQAVLRWRLPKDEWAFSYSGVSNGTVTIALDSTVPLDISLTDGKESRYYGQMQDICVLEARFRVPATIKSRITF